MASRSPKQRCSAAGAETGKYEVRDAVGAHVSRASRSRPSDGAGRIWTGGVVRVRAVRECWRGGWCIEVGRIVLCGSTAGYPLEVSFRSVGNLSSQWPTSAGGYLIERASVGRCIGVGRDSSIWKYSWIPVGTSFLSLSWEPVFAAVSFGGRISELARECGSLENAVTYRFERPR